jgi:hypothetical protein
VLTLAGGALADPAMQIGGIFRRIDFFTEYPYALPTFISGIFGASAAILCALFVKEVGLVLSQIVTNTDIASRH